MRGFGSRSRGALHVKQVGAARVEENGNNANEQAIGLPKMSIPFIQLFGTVQRSDQSSCHRPGTTVDCDCALSSCVSNVLSRVPRGRRVKLPAESGDRRL